MLHYHDGHLHAHPRKIEQNKLNTETKAPGNQGNNAKAIHIVICKVSVVYRHYQLNNRGL